MDTLCPASEELVQTNLGGTRLSIVYLVVSEEGWSVRIERDDLN